MRTRLIHSLFVPLVVLLLLSVAQAPVAAQWKAKSSLAKSVRTAGFTYDPAQDIIVSRMNATQRLVGYWWCYDDVLPKLGMIIDCEPLYFDYKGKEWLIELWKGQYYFETGAEIGVYYRCPLLPPIMREDPRGGSSRPCSLVAAPFAFFFCVPDEDRLQMKFTLYRDGEKLFERGPEEHWWLTGFRWGVFSEPEDLKMDVSITLRDREMCDAFRGALSTRGYKKVTVNGNTVSFTFAKPYTKQPRSRARARKKWQGFNKDLVKKYNSAKEADNQKSNDPNTASRAVANVVSSFFKKFNRMDSPPGFDGRVVNIADIALAFARQLPIDQLPLMQIREIECSRTEDEATFSGDLFVAAKEKGPWVKLGAIDLDVGPEGLSGTGTVKGLKLGPLSWKDGTVRLRATPAESSLVISGGVKLFGSTQQTDLNLTRDGLSFTQTRKILGLWSTELQVESGFDLKKPKWKVHGTLSQDFMDQYGPLVNGGVLNFVGPALAFGDDVLRGAEANLNGIRSELAKLVPGIDKTPLENIQNLISLRLAFLQRLKGQHKRNMDAAYSAWQAQLKKNRKFFGPRAKAPIKEGVYRVLKRTYDEGPLSVVKRYDRVNGRRQFVCEQNVKIREARRAQKKKRKVLRKDLDAINSYSGKKVAVSKVVFDADLEGWLNGAPVQLTLDLLYLGKPRQITMPWTFGKPKENRKNVDIIVAQLAPLEKFAQIQQEHDALVKAGLADCK